MSDDLKDILDTATKAKDKATELAKDGLTGEEVSSLIDTVKSKKSLLTKIAAAIGILLALAGGYFATTGDADEPTAAPTTSVVAPVTNEETKSD